MLVYLSIGSAQTSLHAATLRKKLQIKLSTSPSHSIPWVGVKNFGYTEKQKNIEQGSIKLKELHVCIMRVQKKMARVQKKMAAWRSEVP